MGHLNEHREATDHHDSQGAAVRPPRKMRGHFVGRQLGNRAVWLLIVRSAALTVAHSLDRQRETGRAFRVGATWRDLTAGVLTDGLALGGLQADYGDTVRPAQADHDTAGVPDAANRPGVRHGRNRNDP